MEDKRKPKSNNRLFKAELKDIQKPLIEYLKKNEITVLTGEAGTGKDFVCMYTALKLLSEKGQNYEKIKIAKPIIEVGNSMGMLPGDVKEKTDPYRASFDDIVGIIIGKENTGRVKKLKDSIVFEPVNFVRGNTFKDSIVILSEAQNCTLHELISFITRLDKSSKLFINGDLMQSDIGRNSGLNALLEILSKVEGVGLKTLGDEFQTRNKMITRINREYVKYKAKR